MAEAATQKVTKEMMKEKRLQERLAKEAAEKASRQAELEGPVVNLYAQERPRFGKVMIRSQKPKDMDYLKFCPIKTINAEIEQVWIRARVHSVRKTSGKLCFVVLREGYDTLQGVSVDDLAKFTGALTKESIVLVRGNVKSVPQPTACSVCDFEVQIEQIYCLSRAEVLPLQMEDLERSEQELKENPEAVRVLIDNRLDNRVLDLRTRCNKSIMKMSSHVSTSFRDFFNSKGFVEIHTPKLVPTASEGGADVFQVTYFERFAYLAQSPQLYKQMALMSDLPGVYEVGPVFRAEKSLTHRHMTEFTGLDFEMTINEHFHEILDVVDSLFNKIFTDLNEKCQEEMEQIKKQHPFEPLKWSYPSKRFDYKEYVQLLKKHGPEYLRKDLTKTDCPDTAKKINDHMSHILNLIETDDITTEDERLMGRIVHDQFDTDFFIVEKFPSANRAFYTMESEADPTWSNSYDVFIRGQEIMSGAQRIHDREMLEEKAKRMGVALDGIRSYLDGFRYGALPHGGGGIGLERVVMLFLNLKNIRYAAMFPRDPKRLEP